MRFTAAFIAHIIFVVALYGHVGAAPNPIVNHTPTLGGSEMQSPTPDVLINTSTNIVIHPPGPTPLGGEFPHPTPEARDGTGSFVMISIPFSKLTFDSAVRHPTPQARDGTVRHPTPQARDGEVLRPIPQARE
ncbi:hypothetical protein K439DRAFT_1620263 [Ramaria rubella]|nr:hypothetical protein K439DRAFT_1620263 [Ramaria rubella]